MKIEKIERPLSIVIFLILTFVIIYLCLQVSMRLYTPENPEQRAYNEQLKEKHFKEFKKYYYIDIHKTLKEIQNDVEILKFRSSKNAS